MSVVYKLIVVAVAALAFGSQGSNDQFPFEFGKLRAVVNGRDFTGIFGRDSTIAMWNPSVGQLQIEGARRYGRGRSEIVRIIMRCSFLPRAGNYVISDLRSPVSAEAFLPPTLWQRIWPVHGARRRAFLSDSTARGSLVLDTVDSTNAVVKGRFSVSLSSLDRAPAETLFVRGKFFGRLDLGRDLDGPRQRWAPGMRTDCERIRDAVPL